MIPSVNRYKFTWTLPQTCMHPPPCFVIICQSKVAWLKIPPGFLHTSFLALDPCRLNLKSSKNNTSFKKPYCSCSFANLILAALFFRPTNGFCHITLPLCLLFLLKWPVSWICLVIPVDAWYDSCVYQICSC